MKLNNTVKAELVNIVAMSFETGHFGFDEFEISASLVEAYPEASKEELKDLLKQACTYYDELVNLGPVGFYEEFKGTYDFDPMFVAEYGHWHDKD